MPSISQPRRGYRELHEKEDRLETGGAWMELSIKAANTEFLKSDKDCFSRMVNRNVILSHFWTIDNLDCMLSLFSLSRLIA